MTNSLLITPLDVANSLIYGVNGITDSPFITAKPTLISRQSELFIEDGTQSISIGFQTTFSPSVNQEISVSGRKVAWDSRERAPGGRDFLVRYYDGTTTFELGQGRNPQFYRQGIVWTNDAGLQYFDGQTTQQLSNIPRSGLRTLKVSGNNIVWVGSDGTNSQLYFYNGSTTQQISTDGFNSLGSRANPEFSISGNQVVWSAYALTADGTLDESNRNIYYFDGSTTQQLTTTPILESQVNFYNNKPVWLGATPDAVGNQQIFTYVNGQVQQITNDQNSALVEYTVVDGLLAWEHYDLVSGITDIFIYNGSQVINLTNTADISETIISRGLTDRLYWESAAGRFTYVNGQVQRVDTGEGNYGIVTSKNGNLLLEGYQLSEDQSFSGVYQGTRFDSAKIKRGTANSDRLIGPLTSNIIYGLNGNDTLVGGSGTDNLYGGNGNDDIEGKGGNDLIFGGNGNDRLSGGAGVDVLVGGAGDDRLTGGTGNDKLFGGLGNNKIEGGDGSDYIESGAGNDKIDGGQGNDTIFGGLGIDTIHGGNGNDRITADAGRIYGDGGDDYLTGGEQSILIEGGSGNDTIIGETGFFSSPTVFGAKLSGDGGNDDITGRFGNDTISGGTGNDSVQGQDGNDRIAGDHGNDILIGDAGNDYLEGGHGNDQLTGGLGNDTLNGGAGSDTFVFSSFGPFFDRELGVDKISDFSVAIDKIQLQYNALTPELSFAVVARDINVDTSSAAIVYSQGSGTLFYNGNGAEAGLDNGGAFAILTNRPQNLTASNFVVV